MGARKVVVVVKGEEQDKDLALLGLLVKTDYDDLKRVINQCDIFTVGKIAKICHGRMYRELSIDGRWG